jgi:bacteriorhodopsin
VGVFGAIFALVVPLHLFSMFYIFYTLYFAAKTVKTVELQREVTFSDFAGEFFLIWFYPVGVWIIQPKVNKMIEG